MTDVSGAHASVHPRLILDLLMRSADQLSELSIIYGGYYQQYTYWPIKYAPETEDFRRNLVLNSLLIFQVCRSSQLQDRDNEGRRL